MNPMTPDDMSPGWWTNANTIRTVLGFDPAHTGSQAVFHVSAADILKTKDNPMINTDAQGLAREIITERKTDGLRERVATAVATLTDLFEGAGDGSIFSFAKDVNGRTYHYAAIKSGGKWFSTGSKTALAGGDDDELITWLIGLEVYGKDDILAMDTTTAPALIEGSATDG